MSKALRSAQQSLQQAGQQTAESGGGRDKKKEEGQEGQEGQSGSQGQKGEQSGEGQSEASEAEMGAEFGASQSASQSGSDSGDPSNSQQKGGGRGNAGRGVGGNVGAQQPLPGKKNDKLVRGVVNDKGKKLSRSYMGTPDPTQDRAAYYSVVPDKVKAAEASLNREEIPTGYKKAVRDYFNSIQPR